MRLRKPEKNDWSCVENVVVVYPAVTMYLSNSSEKEYSPETCVRMSYHGRLNKNPKACIVEDENGWIHVVSVDIVYEEVG